MQRHLPPHRRVGRMAGLLCGEQTEIEGFSALPSPQKGIRESGREIFDAENGTRFFLRNGEMKQNWKTCGVKVLICVRVRIFAKNCAWQTVKSLLPPHRPLNI